MANPNLETIMLLAQHLAQSASASGSGTSAAQNPLLPLVQALSPEALAQLGSIAAAHEQAMANAAMAAAMGAQSSAAGSAAAASTSSTSAGSRERESSAAGSASPVAGGDADRELVEDEPAEAPELAEVPKCHMHKKANKVCKFCKAHTAYQEQKTKETEDKKNAAYNAEKTKSAPANASSQRRDQMEKVALPGMANFPSVTKERLMKYRYYSQHLSNIELPEVKDALYDCESCEPEVHGPGTLDTIPSPFFCCVYRMLNLKINEGQMQSLLHNRSLIVRCAGFLFVRLGVHQDRYWELMSDHLMENEEFVPFPGKDGKDGSSKMSEGEFIEQLLTKDKYCDLPLPRIAGGLRKVINERLVLYDQFRKRYTANLEVLDRYTKQSGGVAVEVCNLEGDWSPGFTRGPRSPGHRQVTVPVKFSDGEQREVSIGMLIKISQENGGGARSSGSDLTTSRGQNNKDLLEEFRRSTRDAALASGKNYCKTSGRHTVHVGGGIIVCGADKNRGQGRTESDEEAEEEQARKRRREKEPTREHQQKMAAIMEKYCASGGRGAAGSRSGGSADDPNGVDRMRLG